MKKAEKIFFDTYIECRLYAKRHGIMYNPDGKAIGFNGLITEKPVSVRTFNDVQKQINSERMLLVMNERLGILDADALAIKKYALEMVQSTLDNARKHL